jgi:hypothetical protein
MQRAAKFKTQQDHSLQIRTCRFPASGSRTRHHPRHVVPKPAQAYEIEVPVKVLEWIAPALASPDLVLDAL